MATQTEKVLYLRGILIDRACLGHTITYDEVRRIMRLCDAQIGTLLGLVRQGLQPGEPDLCAGVIKSLGKPGWGWGNSITWGVEVQALWAYWHDRTTMDNAAFEAKYHSLPTYPGENTKTLIVP